MRFRKTLILFQAALVCLWLQPLPAGAETTRKEAAQYQAGARALVAGEYADAIKIWTRLGRRGNIDACFNLGVLYAEGRVVEPDARKAVRWLKKAARKGHAEAQYNLGHLYMQGARGKPKPKKAVKWWREAAKGGLLVAQYNLGYALYHGIGADADQAEAMVWLQRAAAGGESRSSAFLEANATPAAQDGDPGIDEAQQPAPLSGPDSSNDETLSAKREATATEAVNIETKPAPATPLTISDAQRTQLEDARIGDPPRNDGPWNDNLWNDHGWLFAQEPENVTLQLASLRNVSTVEKIVRDNGFASEGGKFFTTLIDGEHWIYMLYGSFPNTESAEAALAGLPRWAQAGRLRRFSDLQLRRCRNRQTLQAVLSQDEAADLDSCCGG